MFYYVYCKCYVVGYTEKLEILNDERMQSMFLICGCTCISRVPGQNGVSPLYIMLEIHHSDREPSIYVCVCVCVHACAHK